MCFCVNPEFFIKIRNMKKSGTTWKKFLSLTLITRMQWPYSTRHIKNSMMSECSAEKMTLWKDWRKSNGNGMKRFCRRTVPFQRKFPAKWRETGQHCMTSSRKSWSTRFSLKQRTFSPFLPGLPHSARKMIRKESESASFLRRISQSVPERSPILNSKKFLLWKSWNMSVNLPGSNIKLRTELFW